MRDNVKKLSLLEYREIVYFYGPKINKSLKKDSTEAITHDPTSKLDTRETKVIPGLTNLSWYEKVLIPLPCLISVLWKVLGFVSTSYNLNTVDRVS